MFVPLIKTCQQLLGNRLFVLPYYGYGWNRKGIAAPPKSRMDMLGPEPFQLRFDECLSCNEQLMGVSGIIDEPEHPFNKHWCGSFLRTTENNDFTTSPGQYMIWIAPAKLPVNPAPEKALYEWVTFDKSALCLCGYGTVAESVQWIQDIFNRTMASRKLVAEQSSG